MNLLVKTSLAAVFVCCLFQSLVSAGEDCVTRECMPGCKFQKIPANEKCGDCVCPREPTCRLPQVVGVCKAYMPHYFYNGTSGKCELFIYGGCNGNANNFVTKEKCFETCISKKPPAEVCPMPKCPANCKFYPPGNGKCGRCRCSRETFTDVCKEPKVVGPCEALVRRFYFNSTTGKCEEFFYGGCQGNNNNFPSAKECEAKCLSKVASGVNPTGDKPGMCPVVRPQMGICVEQCVGDSACPGTQKCCSNGCGHVCTDPQGDKPGVCPYIRPGQIGTCVEACIGDSVCPGKKKCCSNGCGHVCREPQGDKPGVCPYVRPGQIGTCVEACIGDSVCPGTQKCCSNGCGHVCREPQGDKPGMCPYIRPGQMGICLHQCGGDSFCPGNQKCCFNGCGHVCSIPQGHKPGVCPYVRPGQVGACVSMCKDDSICPGIKKCCSNGCGHVCANPQGVEATSDD